MIANGVQETTTTTGTGTLTLTLATGYVRFSEAFSVGSSSGYAVRNGNNWEWGSGTVGAGDTLERTTVHSTLVGGVYTSGGTTPISLVGASTVFCTLTAEAILDLESGVVTDHGALSGLSDDDHTLYHTDARGDARYEATGSVSTHNAVNTAHGISSFGATLVDDADAATARSTLVLGAVDNTSDANKPVSTAQQTALNLKADLSSPTFTGTVVGITAVMVGAPSGSGTSTGSNTGDSATPAETTASIGALLNGATSKTTPVDADQMGIMDSAASNIWKKLSWSNLKTALSSIFVLLAGKSGGQTIIGGTAASENLTLQSTSHATKGKILLGSGSAYDGVNDRIGVGTTAPSAKVHSLSTTEQLRLGYDAGNYAAFTTSSAGTLTIAATSGQYVIKGAIGTVALGSELVVNGAFSSDLTGWSDSGSSWSWSSGTALHTAGSASTLSQNISVSNGTAYQIEFTIVGRTAGSVGITLGAVVADAGGTAAFSSSNKVSVKATASGSVAFTINPTSDFNGSIDDVTVKSIGVNTPSLTVLDSTGGVSNEFRGNATNFSLGVNAHYSLTTGGSNLALGGNAQRSLTTGGSNLALGRYAQYSLTTGYYNLALGQNAQYSLTTGVSNLALGQNAQYLLTTGYYNVALGTNAQRFIADGATEATVFDSCIHLGYNTKLSANSVSNETVIGANGTGLGSNTATIGGSSVTRTGLRGSVEVIASSSTTAAQSQAGISASWVDSTHATRKARGVLTAWDYTAGREAIRWEANGSVPLLGFFGASAVIKPTALTATVAAAPAGGTGTAGGGWDTSTNRDLAIATINNLKTRVDQLESKLQALGLLT